MTLRTPRAFAPLVVAALVLALPLLAAAQVGYFQEVSVPTAPADLYVGPGDYFEGEQVFIRSTQQGVRFDLGSDETTSLRVSVDGDPFVYIYQGADTQEVVWNTPPTELADTRCWSTTRAHSGTHGIHSS